MNSEFLKKSGQYGADKNRKIGLFIGNTGSGKSVTIPVGIFRGFKTIGMHNKILVSLPTIISVKSIFQMMTSISKNKRSEAHGITYGYAYRENVNYDNKTDIVYATSGYVRNLLLAHYGEKGFFPFDAIVVDEAHTRSANNTVISYLVSKDEDIGKIAYVTASKSFKIKDDSKNIFEYILEEETNINVKFLKSTPKNRFKIYEATEIYVRELLKNLGISNPKIIIVFVATTIEVINYTEKLKNANLSIPVYSITAGSIENAYLTPNDSRILVTTNVLESSVTIKGVNIVIDTMYELRPSFYKNTYSLTYGYISKSSSEQRMGRAGRGEGVTGLYFPLISEKDYKDDNIIPPVYEEEALSSDIDRIILLLISKDIHPSDVFTLSNKKIDREISMLLNFSFISKENKTSHTDSYFLTEKGNEFLAQRNLSTLSFNILSKWIKKYPEHINTGILLSTIINTDLRGIIHGDLKNKGDDLIQTIYNCCYEARDIIKKSYNINKYQILSDWAKNKGLHKDIFVELIIKYLNIRYQYYIHNFNLLENPMRKLISVVKDMNTLVLKKNKNNEYPYTEFGEKTISNYKLSLEMRKGSKVFPESLYVLERFIERFIERRMDKDVYYIKKGLYIPTYVEVPKTIEKTLYREEIKIPFVLLPRSYLTNILASDDIYNENIIPPPYHPDFLEPRKNYKIVVAKNNRVYGSGMRGKGAYVSNLEPFNENISNLFIS